MASSLAPPYYAVIFTSRKKPDSSGYDEMAKRMQELGSRQDGFLGIESVRGADGFGITVSYWKSLEAIGKWKANAEHLEAQRRGQAEWYSEYRVRVCRVDREYG